MTTDAVDMVLEVSGLSRLRTLQRAARARWVVSTQEQGSGGFECEQIEVADGLRIGAWKQHARAW